jgi:hypothetical protein
VNPTAIITFVATVSLCVTASGGCGRVRFEPTSADGGVLPFDANPDGAEILNPVLLPGVTGFDPDLSSDGLELWFTNTNFDLALAKRSSRSEPFAVQPQALLSSTSNDIDPSLSEDGLVLMFVSDRTGIGRIYTSTRATRSAEFLAPTLALGLETIQIDSIDLSPDALTLYVVPTDFSFHRYRRASRVVDFVEEMALSRPNDFGGFPSLTPDGATLYYNAAGQVQGSIVTTKAVRNTTQTGYVNPVAETFGGPSCTRLGDPNVSTSGREVVYQCDDKFYVAVL